MLSVVLKLRQNQTRSSLQECMAVRGSRNLSTTSKPRSIFKSTIPTSWISLCLVYNNDDSFCTSFESQPSGTDNSCRTSTGKGVLSPKELDRWRSSRRVKKATLQSLIIFGWEGFSLDANPIQRGVIPRWTKLLRCTAFSAARICPT